MNPSAQALARRLAAFGGSGTFATRFAVDADPQLHIEGIGQVRLPVTIRAAHQLCAAAQPALHGYKDQTRLDPRVRDTWEIPAGRVRVDDPGWQTVLDDALQRIRRDLVLPLGGSLNAELHNLLIYAPGQFFAVHQDSEKTDGMVGSLVVTLPSSFTGGEFIVSHQGQTLRSRSSAKRVGMMAFYADCHHEVRPVKQGYRVVLTYNLVMQAATQPVDAPAQDIATLAAAIRTFWQTPAPPRWNGDRAGEPPDRLVYLLDHQYTQRGLAWAQLKGADASRAAALQRAAESLDAEIFLALADVHETWSAESDYQPRRGWEYAEDDEDEDEPSSGGGDEPALEDLIDSDVELRHGIAPDGNKLAVEANAVAADELCFTRASVECTPFQSEHEGYMGNYGNTVDRWYHRAAIVMWPRERAFVIRARQSPRWAITQIAERLDAGDGAQATAWAQRLLPCWEQAVRATDAAALFEASWPVALALADADTAAALLAPFALSHLAPRAAPWLVRLLDRRGMAWCSKRIGAWADNERSPENQLLWLAQTLPNLTHAWSRAANKDGPPLAAALVQERWRWLQKYLAGVQARTGRSERVRALADTSPALLALIRGAHHARRADLQRELIDAASSTALPPQVVLGILRAAGPEAADAASLTALHAHAVHTLTARLAQPERSADDWSIPPPAECTGDLGRPLARFLADPKQKRLEWPLAEAKRKVIHRFIDGHELPVRHATRRSGSPYTLVLEKTRALFEREAAERRQCMHELAWLQKTASRFAPPGSSSS